MTNEPTLGTANGWTNGELIEIDLNFASMRQFQAQFSPNLSKDGLFIDTGEPLSPGSVVRFRVILPEDFVFLEGTAVVEWVRPAEALADGVPGMALRFATLSPQNQELVEQLVQDHVDQGGTPFDLDVRPAPADFPTDALEGASSGIGAPARDGTVQEGFRLTIRGAGPSAAEAMQALREAAPAVGAEEHGFDIAERAPHGVVGDRVEEPEAPAVEEPADPPELEWDDDAPAEPA
ncbi:MAG TPA: PilZ domain-containing protein, partial [Methylomirabilota bacterium]|nr:PilZ domain-containing protein [Methylomirabilota bacterium]